MYWAALTVQAERAKQQVDERDRRLTERDEQIAALKELLDTTKSQMEDAAKEMEASLSATVSEQNQLARQLEEATQKVWALLFLNSRGKYQLHDYSSLFFPEICMKLRFVHRFSNTDFREAAEFHKM